MGYTNSDLVEYTDLSPNHSGKRTHEIDRITPHCTAGMVTAEGLGGWFSLPSTQASSNYGIDRDGRIGLYVEEKNRSWCSSSNANDQRAVTIECASDIEEPYEFPEVTYQKLILLCEDICRRNGKKKLLWLGDKDRTLNYSPKADEMVLTAHRFFANKSCIPVDSEVLTREGWVKLSDIQVGEKIACADIKNLRITFEEVYDKVPERDEDTYTNSGFTATKDHRCVYRCQGQGECRQEEYRMEDYKNLLAAGGKIYLPLAGYAENGGLNLTDDELRLLVAVQADGQCMPGHDGKEDASAALEFYLKKEGKVERIKQLLDSCHLEYTQEHTSDGSVSIRAWGKAAVDVCEKYLAHKCFHWGWINMSRRQAEIFLSELLLWNGSAEPNLYRSREQINLDVVSAVAALNGVGISASGSGIQFLQEPFCLIGREENSTRRNDRSQGSPKMRVSCVSVKTGIFLVRQNGKTFLTGNCPGNWMYSRMGDLAEKVTALLEGKSAQTESSLGEKKDALAHTPFLVKTGDLPIHEEASWSSRQVGQTGEGIFTILEKKDGWGRLKSGAGWICLEDGDSPSQGEDTQAEAPEKAPKGMQAAELDTLTDEQVLTKVGPLFTQDQKRSGILASVSLAQFILESGFGKSELAQKANNCFGMKTSLSGNTWEGSTWDGKGTYTKQTGEQKPNGSFVTITADFRKYSCLEDSIADHSAYLLGAKNGSVYRYEGLKGCTDYEQAAKIIRGGGYATDSAYVEKICSLIRKWDLTQYEVKAETPKVKENTSSGKKENKPEKPKFYLVRKSWEDRNSQIGAFTVFQNAINCVDANPGYAAFEDGTQVYPKLSSESYLVRVSDSDVNYRKGPGTGYGSWGYMKPGIYTIVDEQDGWGLLKAYAAGRNGWVSLGNTNKI